MIKKVFSTVTCKCPCCLRVAGRYGNFQAFFLPGALARRWAAMSASTSSPLPNCDNSMDTPTTLGLEPERHPVLGDRIRKDKVATEGKATKAVPWLEKVLYNSFLQGLQPHTGFRKRVKERSIRPVLEAKNLVDKVSTILPISARLVDDSLTDKVKTDGKDEERVISADDEDDDGNIHFPYKQVTKFEMDSEVSPKGKKYMSEAEKLAKHGVSTDEILTSNAEEESEQIDDWVGTPMPDVPMSNVPCGGCGAPLHCQDIHFPGYMPSEKFTIRNDKSLREELCLRCSNLRVYNAAMNVNVSPEDYPVVLRKIEEKFAMVILLLDLTDFPCSIWPGITEIIGMKRPVFLVGNKVDLIPRDSQKYLDHIRECLMQAAVHCGLDATNIVHTSLISAATGFGVEELISTVYRVWGNDGDIFIMGCTNVGKSTLFNLFLQSDLCKTHVVDRIQQATVSQWPGTTVNLLKFPIMADNSWRMALRLQRLNNQRVELEAERRTRASLLQQTKNTEYAVLKGHVGRTFLSKEKEESATSPLNVKDVFQVSHKGKTGPSVPKVGQWDPSDPEIQGKWCYDTPGAVSDNQILDILTNTELKKILPTKLIEPRTFYIKEGMTMFLGGIARIDYVEGIKPIRYTVFTSNRLPVTIVLTEDADEVYEQALGTPVFSVPSGSEERLKDFPKLKSRDFEIVGTGHTFSCSDLVLSSAGWVAVTAPIDKRCKLRVHTPNAKGMFLRTPAMLRYAVGRKGPRIRDTPAYLPHKIYAPPPFMK